MLKYFNLISCFSSLKENISVVRFSVVLLVLLISFFKKISHEFFAFNKLFYYCIAINNSNVRHNWQLQKENANIYLKLENSKAWKRHLSRNILKTNTLRKLQVVVSRTSTIITQYFNFSSNWFQKVGPTSYLPTCTHTILSWWFNHKHLIMFKRTAR